MVIPRLMPTVRILFAAIVGLAVAAPLVFADEPGATRIRKIGLLSWSSCKNSDLASTNGEWAQFLEGLRELGYEPGTNVEIDCRSAGGTPESFDAAATELVKIPVDVIVSTTAPGAAAVRHATKSIPHVAIDEGLFGNSFADPRTNYTGLINYWIDLTGKRLEILKEAVPGLKQVGILSSQRGLYKSYESHARRAAKDLSLELSVYRITTPAELADTFSLMKAQHVEAVFLLPDLMFESEAARISGLAIKYKLPTMAWDTRLTQKGFLLAYSSDSGEQKKRLAFYVDKILNGASPQELPIEQPSTFLLSVNLQTARSIGITLPRSIMLMAEEIIE